MAEALPLLVERVCGLPVRALDALAAPETMAAVRRALACRDEAVALAEQISEDLYRLVPSLDDAPQVRRAALRVRRDAHNLRLTPATREAIALVVPRLDASAAERLHRYALAAQSRLEWLDKAAEAARAELPATGRAALTWLRDPRIAAGLALASPLFAAELLDADGMEWDSRLARSAAAYLTRTAVKPSPFATLATVGLRGIASATTGADATTVPGAAPDGPGDAGWRTWSSSRIAAQLILRAIAEHPDGPEELPVVRNRSLRAVRDRLLGLLPTYAQARGVFFREDELTDCGEAARALAALPDGPLPLRAAAAAMDVPVRTARRMIATGLLLPVTPWSPHDGRHFAALAGALPADVPLADAVRLLARLEAELAEAPARQRAHAPARAHAALKQGFAAARRRPPDWLEVLPLFHETAAHAPAESGPAADGEDEALTERLTRIAAALTPAVRRLALYDRLVEFFVYRHGHGGTAPDLLAFCYDFLTTADPVRLFGEQNRFSPEPPADVRGHGTLGAAMSTVFFQTAGDLLVVNRVHQGFAGLLARWGVVPALHDALAERLGDWLSRRHPGCRVYQWSAHADWVDFQRPALRSLPYVAWSTELAMPGATVDLRGFSLRHEPGTGTLQAVDPEGRPAAFAYLGAIPPMLLRGVDRVIHTLCDPWGIQLPGDDGRMGHQPRLERDGVVWRRARWRLAPEELPRPDQGKDPVAFLDEVERWRRDLGLPDEVFLRQEGPQADNVRPDKPQWLGFDHPHVIRTTLRQLRANLRSVEIVEALPDRRRHKGAFATEFVGMVRHG